MARIIDTIIALRVAYILITPVQDTDAFKLGLIDINGKTIRKASTSVEKNATSPLHRMCWNLKRIISLVPGGSTKIGSLAAAWLLMKEAYENEWTDQELLESTINRFNILCEKNVNEELDPLLDAISTLYEDAPANATGVATSTDSSVATKKIGLARRKKYKVIQLPE